MIKDVSVVDLRNNNALPESVEVASKCPVCGTTLLPKVIAGVILLNNDADMNGRVFLLNYCANCGECFISRHTAGEDDNYLFHSSAPLNCVNIHFSEAICNLSPDFRSIYNESLRAENLGMYSICGMGYRKAFEFLIKDYAISKNPDSEEKITNMPLSACIKTYIQDERLKSLATASVWLGNDETHYKRKHSDHGLAELKLFIDAFVTFIDADLAYQAARSFISSDS